LKAMHAIRIKERFPMNTSHERRREDLTSLGKRESKDRLGGYPS